MQRIAISTPLNMIFPITDFADNWLKPFILSNVADLDLTQEQAIEFTNNHFDQTETSLIQGKLLFTHVATVPYSMVAKQYMHIGENALIMVNDSKDPNALCHVGMAFFENNATFFYQNTAVIVVQDADRLDEISLEAMTMNYMFKDRYYSKLDKIA